MACLQGQRLAHSWGRWEKHGRGVGCKEGTRRYHLHLARMWPATDLGVVSTYSKRGTAERAALQPAGVVGSSDPRMGGWAKKVGSPTLRGYSQAFSRPDHEGSGGPRPSLPARHLHSCWGNKQHRGCEQGGICARGPKGASPAVVQIGKWRPQPKEGWITQPLQVQSDSAFPQSLGPLPF